MRCITEGCEELVSNGGARGMCQRCYRLWREKVLHKETVRRAPSVHEEAVNGVVLPVRTRRWEWLGSLSESLRAFNASLEELEND
jgi:hypothetical protein